MTCTDCYWYQHENCEGTHLSPRYCRTFLRGKYYGRTDSTSTI